MERDELICYLTEYLHLRDIEDYGPQGLQVEGKTLVRKIVTAVSASLQLFEQAVELDADLIMVHHGLLWDRDDRVIKGSFKKRLQILLQHDISLLGLHLALDKHEQLGNNVLGARALGGKNLQPWGDVGIRCELAPIGLAELVDKTRSAFQHEPLVFAHGPKSITRIGVCSGRGQHDIGAAIDADLHAFISGEASEDTMHQAREGCIHFIAAGHYATERLGIRALGEHIADKFQVSVTFIDIPNPV